MHWVYGTCKHCGNTFRYMSNGVEVLDICTKCASKHYTKITIDQIMEQLVTLENRIERLENMYK